MGGGGQPPFGWSGREGETKYLFHPALFGSNRVRSGWMLREHCKICCPIDSNMCRDISYLSGWLEAGHMCRLHVPGWTLGKRITLQLSEIIRISPGSHATAINTCKAKQTILFLMSQVSETQKPTLYQAVYIKKAMQTLSCRRFQLSEAKDDVTPRRSVILKPRCYTFSYFLNTLEKLVLKSLHPHPCRFLLITPSIKHDKCLPWG